MAIDEGEIDLKIPCVTASENKIKADAPKALTCLQRFNQLELADVLGLRPYLQEEPT